MGSKYLSGVAAAKSSRDIAGCSTYSISVPFVFTSARSCSRDCRRPPPTAHRPRMYEVGPLITPMRRERPRPSPAPC
jgi:hypothetical protein